MVLRNILNNAKRLAPNIRTMASQGPFVDLRVDNDGISIMTMQRPPVNSLNLDMLKELNESLDEVAKNKSRGLILTSSSPTVFSAGLDLMEIYKPDLKRIEEFSTMFQDVWIKLFGSNFVTAAAINGHAPAGGCLLAMSCEYRVMVQGKFTIGLNETALGIVASSWFMDTMFHTIPIREAEHALTSARMFSVDEALKVRLIDESATDKTDAINKCKNFIKKFDKIPPLARSITKQKIRQNYIKKLQENRAADTEEVLSHIRNPNVQRKLEMYIQSLKKKDTKD
ncbi:enoyl-CoA delta isomerase 1, mitochondrial-like [Vanessa cardui]|uniref:enoyl-CoA delta isomerase 1, mitochondrial-like n=1 Tax=Vanessa cardui TaxID=171605 RepID=UPI001F1408C2|nr:enoyl-CoA delta isomerase 1, mitochondrial-like [Vanessa cardui]